MTEEVTTGTGEMIAGMTEIEGMTEEDMTGTGGMTEAMIGTDVTIGAPTGTVAMTETAGMVIVATTERMNVGTATVMMTAAVSATAEMTMTEEVIGEVRKRTRVIVMGKKRELQRRLLLRRA